MSDDVQRVLERYHRGLGDAGFEGVLAEWRGWVRAELRGASEEEVDELVQGAVVDLVLVAPRALAPPGTVCPRAWRRRVVRNWLFDRLRRRRRRVHAVLAMAMGWSPRTEKAAWREGLGVEGPGPRPEVVMEAGLAEGLDGRRQLAAWLPELPVRWRVLVVLGMGGDPRGDAAELAGCLGEEVGVVRRRMEGALAAGHDGGHDYLSVAMVRVVYPEPKPLGEAREAARKAFERGVGALRGRVAA